MLDILFNHHSYEEVDQMCNEIFKQLHLSLQFSQKPTVIHYSFILYHLLMKKGEVPGDAGDVFDCM